MRSPRSFVTAPSRSRLKNNSALPAIQKTQQLWPYIQAGSPSASGGGALFVDDAGDAVEAGVPVGKQVDVLSLALDADRNAAIV